MTSDIPPVTIETVISLILAAYNWLTNTLTGLLADTVFKARPELASQFGNALTSLIGFTAIYILLIAFDAIKKILGYILAIGWILLMVAMALTLL